MPHQIAELSQLFNELISAPASVGGEFDNIGSPGAYSASSLIFVSDAADLPNLAELRPAAIVTDEKIAAVIDDECTVLVATNVRLAQAIIKQHYQDYDATDPEWDAVHSSAVIHASARLHKSVRVGANTVIGANVEIAKDTVVRAACVIESGARIGANCIINNLVNIGQGCVLGNRVIIRPGAIIGNEGFGFAQDEQKHYQRIPHTGIVRIEDDVQIGSNCNIDRATYGQTLIKRGVKIDALCHIGHNCIIDEDALFVAQSGIAGSCNIGKRVICSGQTGMLDHKTVAADAILVHRCGVTDDIPHGGMWAGTPAKPFKEYVRNLNSTKKIDKLERTLALLQKQVDSLTK